MEKLENAKDKKTYTAEDLRAARLLGKQEAEECYRKRLNLVYTTNHKLLVEIFRLDLNEPVVAVPIPYKFAQLIIEKLKKRNRKDWHARMLKYYMNRSDREVFGGRGDIMAELENG